MNGRGARWLSYVTPVQQPDVVELAVDTDRTIKERPTTIVVTRDRGDGNVIALLPQVVRIDVIMNIRGAGEQRDAMVSVSKQYTVLIGYKDHPIIKNTDLQRDDTFFFQRREYKIVELTDTVPGRLLAGLELTP